MPFYAEFPTDPVVNVNWKKKDGDGGGIEEIWPCGAFRHGYGRWDPETGLYSFGDIPGNSIFILTSWNIYGTGVDHNPDRKPYQPYANWPSLGDYLPSPFNQLDVPYVWAAPKSWTITYDFAEAVRRLEKTNPYWSLDSVQFQEFRNINRQQLDAINDYVLPDRVVEGPVIDIEFQTKDEIFPPGFRVMKRLNQGFPPLFLRRDQYPPCLVQAHCEHETIGEYPPRPPQLVRGVPYDYPLAGSNTWPIRPPPPPPFDLP